MLNGLAAAGLEVERLMWRHFGIETLAVYCARLPVKRSSSAGASI